MLFRNLLQRLHLRSKDWDERHLVPDTLIPTSLAPEDSEIVEAIRAAGWWQGSLIEGKYLCKAGANLPAHDFFLVASQSCSIQNGDLDKVPMVELIGATKIETAKQNLLAGWNPRILHLLPTNEHGAACPIELKIHERYWIERRILCQIAQSSFSLKSESENRSVPPKTVFAKWLGLSYTRMELPDAFNNALQRSKIQKFIGDRLGLLHERIHGVFFEISNAESDGENSVSPEQMAFLAPPYDLEITIVIYDEADRQVLEQELAKIFALNTPDPNGAVDEQGKPVRRSKADIAKEYGVSILGGKVNVDTVMGWRTKDLLRTVRYTEIDYMSGTEEDTD